MKNSIVFVTAILWVSISSAKLPVPAGCDGPVQGAATAPILFEAFIDLLCPFSKTTFDNLKPVIAHYNNGTDHSSVQFVFHTTSLPDHHNAFFACEVAHSYAAAYGAGSKEVFVWIQAIFDNMGRFRHAYTPAQVKTAFAFVASKAGLDNSVLAGAFMSQKDARSSECGKRVSTIPEFLINGVSVAGSSTWSLDEWKIVIDPFLALSLAAIENSTCPSGRVSCEYLPGKFQCCFTIQSCVPNVGCRC